MKKIYQEALAAQEERRFRRGPISRWGGASAPNKHFCGAKILAEAELISAEQ